MLIVMRRTDTLSNGYKIIQDDSAFCFGIDAVLISEFARLKKGDSVVDLGTGNGIIPLLLCARSLGLKSSHNAPDCRFTGIEIQAGAVALARESVRLNGLEDRISVVQGNLRQVRELFPAQSADVVISNPPYMLARAAKDNATPQKTIARHEVLCSLQDVVGAAKWLLKSNGRFYLIHRPYRLQEIFSALESVRLTPRKMQFVHPKISEPPEMVMLEARPAYKPDLKVLPPLIMYGADGEYTEQFKNFRTL